jgi:hypothetical protein
LVVSEVASGPNRRDMTEWGLRDLRGLIPDLNRVMDASLGSRGDAAYKVKSYKSVPLLPDSGAPDGKQASSRSRG